MRSGACFRREAWEPPTGASESSSWPTAGAQISNDGEAPETWEARRQKNMAKGYNGNGMGTPLTIAATTWQTPNLPNGGGKTRGGDRGDELLLEGQAATWLTPHGMANVDASGHRGAGGEFAKQACEAMEMWGTPTSHERTHDPRDVDHGTQLANQTATWNTPAATDHKGSTAPGAGRGQLSEQTETTEAWATPKAVDGHKPSAGKRATSDLSHQAQVTPDGETSSPSPRGCRPRLNPAFVCWLMGWKWWWTNPEWTSCERQATAWCGKARRWLSAFCGDD